MKPLLVFGYGNPGRGDDGLGPAFVDAVQAMNLPHIECQTDMQLQVEHVMDMLGRNVVLFVDADISCPPAFQLRQITPKQDDSYSSHAMSPQALLFAYAQVHKRPPPPTFVLHIRGTTFELGDELSSDAQQGLTKAIQTIQPLLQTTTPQRWEILAGSN